MSNLNKVGLIIFSIGLVAIIGFGLFKLFKDAPQIPVVIRFGLTAILSGIFIILYSLIRERINDKEL